MYRSIVIWTSASARLAPRSRRPRPTQHAHTRKTHHTVTGVATDTPRAVRRPCRRRHTRHGTRHTQTPVQAHTQREVPSSGYPHGPPDLGDIALVQGSQQSVSHASSVRSRSVLPSQAPAGAPSRLAAPTRPPTQPSVHRRLTIPPSVTHREREYPYRQHAPSIRRGSAHRAASLRVAQFASAIASSPRSSCEGVRQLTSGV